MLATSSTLSDITAVGQNLRTGSLSSVISAIIVVCGVVLSAADDAVDLAVDLTVVCN